MIKSTADLQQIKERFTNTVSGERKRISVCAGTGCVVNGSLKVIAAFEEEIKKRGLLVDLKMLSDGCEGVRVSQTGCHGFCQMGPLVYINPGDMLLVKVTVDDVPEIVEFCILKDELPPEKNRYHHPQTDQTYIQGEEIPFYKRQNRRVLHNCGHIDPANIEEYIAKDGYFALAKAITEKTPEEVCQIVIDSGLRGRGGGGFPSGRKWLFTRKAEGDKKYVVCNGDEGDPGAFMDRSVMEGDPHKLIEGMVIAAYAVGADEGYIYVRAEYPLAIQRLQQAIKTAESQGLLGNNILGSDFSFTLHISKGAGAFVCGEETALLASIEGNRGMPRPKPPYPANKGLFDRPTVINNVETFANVPAIVLAGADTFKSVGTEQSPGTKTFALTGEIANTGLIEVPMGTSLGDIVFEIGGGMRQNKEFKAVQIGGPSGGCLTKDHLEVPLDFDSLKKYGAMIGSGGLVVMDEGTCMVEVARFFMKFAQNESCGKCVLCREGTKRMLEILDKIVAGQGELSDLDLLVEIGEAVKAGSLCGLGKTAPNPVLTTMKYFKEEYLAHVVDKRCPAGVCQSLKKYVIDPEKCRGCSKCARQCPAGCISGKIKEPFVIDQDACLKCGSCVAACPFGAIEEVA
ncbi:MAG: NADH-quinone oxidoreductase subunit NuoF [Limnochordia bacterium]|jgi:NADH-quinone oxidoreductase subunit F|nr:NADH-quinone oxidoreductase subunit NuoF [Limnochordia bacterium]MDD4518970.1 NADH-quinone oxidoreductase subunit NuoF [Limnochordia bacterium]